MEVELVRTFRFDAAHNLTSVCDDHKCSKIHGHGYKVDIHLAGNVDPATGWLMDYHQLKSAVQGVIDSLDHKNLNDIEGLENPTSENLAAYIWNQLIAALPELSAVTVWESDQSRCVYRGN